MDFSHYSDQPVQTAVDLVNTIDVVSGEEKLASLDDLEAFMKSHAGEWDFSGLEPTERDLHETRALRARLRQVFVAPDEASAVETLNDLLADTNAVPRVSLHGPGPHLHFESDTKGPARWLGAITAMGLSVAMIEGGYDRFGTCDSATCDDVYVDSSRNKSRQNCSETCTTRENVAAYRARQTKN